MNVQGSFRRRLLVTAVTVSALFVLLTAAVLERAFRAAQWARLDAQLEAETFALLAVADKAEDGELRLPRFLADDRFNQLQGGRFARVLNEQGEEIWRSASAALADWPLAGTMPIGQASIDTSVVGQTPVYERRFGVAWSDESGDSRYTFVVAEASHSFDEALSSFRWTMLGWLAVLGLALVVMQVLLLRKLLLPMRTIEQELDEVEQGNRQKLGEHYPLELRRLTRKINQLIAFEARQRERYSNSLGDLAHSLKTPLAVITSETERSSPDMKVIAGAVERMDRTVTYYLNRARAVGAGSSGEKVRLDMVLAQLTEALRKVYAEKRLVLEQDLIPAEVEGVEGDLFELFGNLLDNACKYARGRVRVTLQDGNGSWRVDIQDDGPGIPDAERERIFRRGVRLDESLGQGHGIGLSVASEIIRAYEGHLEVSSSEWGGTRMVVTLSRMSP
jgi:two-component system sensor histidine kinase PhoQ